MDNVKRHFDAWSWGVILVTLALFVVALFEKGLTHDMLLEAGVFLVSVKLILMTYKNGVATDELRARLDEIHAALSRRDSR